MKPAAPRNLSAFTRIELLVLILVVADIAVLVALAMLLPARPHQHSGDWISCGGQLREIGMAYRLWAEDNGNRNPAEETVANGGWKDLLTNADQGAICWTNYAIMQNELGRAPRQVICPRDKRVAATSFTNNFNNTHLSYFVGVSANAANPQSILGGDRNLGPGSNPHTDYGFSPKSGKGNDVAVPISGPVSWSLKMHAVGVHPWGGNILLGDGSVQSVATVALNQNYLHNANPTTNWPAGHVPATPSIRLVFP